MVAQGRGRIVNISSIGAYMVSGVYGVSKLALNQLTYALAKELGQAGVTVNAVAPGPIDNDASRKQVPPAAMDRLRDTTLVKRLGDADDIYGMIAYLASDGAAWVTRPTSSTAASARGSEGSMATTGGAVVAALEALGVEHVFGIVSVHNLPIVGAIERSDDAVRPGAAREGGSPLRRRYADLWAAGWP